MALEVTLLAVCFCLLCTWCWTRLRKKSMNIPGPRGLPILGSAYTLERERPMMQLLAWSRQYGPVFSVKTLGVNRVVLADYDSVREALVTRGRSCADRYLTTIKRYVYKDTGLTNSSYGSKLRESRLYVHRHIRHYGEGVPRIEGVIREASDEMFQHLLESRGQPIDPMDCIASTARNIMYTLIMGHKPTPGKVSVMDLLTQLERDRNDGAIETVQSILLDAFPWMRHLGYRVYTKHVKMHRKRREIWNIVKAMLAGDTENPGLAKAMIQESQPQDSVLDDYDVQMTCVNGFLAGVATTTASFYILLNVLLRRPGVANTLYQEVERIVPRDRHVSLIDRAKMPYAQAVMFELLRYSSIAPMALAHQTLADTHIQGHVIPKGTRLDPFLWGVHHDERFWGDPFVFRPERFLDDSGELVSVDHPNRRHVMAFGAGPRRCPGESLALARLFLWTATLVRTFTLSLGGGGHGHDDVIFDPRNHTMASVARMPPFKLRFLTR